MRRILSHKPGRRNDRWLCAEPGPDGCSTRRCGRNLSRSACACVLKPARWLSHNYRSVARPISGQDPSALAQTRSFRDGRAHSCEDRILPCSEKLISWRRFSYIRAPGRGDCQSWLSVRWSSLLSSSLRIGQPFACMSPSSVTRDNITVSIVPWRVETTSSLSNNFIWGVVRGGRGLSDWFRIARLTCGWRIKTLRYAVHSSRVGGEFASLAQTFPTVLGEKIAADEFF